MSRILVVDDDQLVRAAIEVCLRRGGHEVFIADGGDAGIRALQSQAFEVMLVDIFMPRMRGFDSIRLFHEAAPEIPLIAISGYSFAALEIPGVDLERMAIEHGAARCLRKPFRPDTLLAVIAECLAASAPRARQQR